ncbi:MAG: VOC family protein [Acidimicrobiales bacterium]
MTTPDPNLPSIYPVLRYKDVPRAIEFLTNAFGLTEESVHGAPDGTIVHAELGWGNSLIMLGTSTGGDSPFDVGPSCLYLAVDDPDAHHQRAVAAGADIVMPLTDQEHGSRDYAARDDEGNIWSFGTYRPAPGNKVST